MTLYKVGFPNSENLYQSMDHVEQKSQKVIFSLHWSRAFDCSESVGMEFDCEVWKCSSPEIMVIHECNINSNKFACIQ